MSFDNPRYLYFLFLFVIFIPIAILRYRKGRAGAELFAAAAPSEERESLLRELRLRMIFSEIFFLFFIGFLVIALAGPRWGLRIVADYRRGVDVILAFDVSRAWMCRTVLRIRRPPARREIPSGNLLPAGNLFPALIGVRE